MQQQSLNAKAWQRLKNNKSAMVGLWIVLFAFLTAVFAYAIAPDNTPDANEQHLELELKPPLYHIQFFCINKDKKTLPDVGFIDGLINGKPTLYTAIPIDSFSLEARYAKLYEYKGANFSAEERLISYEEIMKEDSAMIGGKAIAVKELINNESLRHAYHENIRERVVNAGVITRHYWLGTDRFGRDILSRLIIGTRVSLSVGLISVLISLLIGITLGAIAGYFRGIVDEIVMWCINVFWSIPTLLLAMGLYVGVGGIIDSKLWLIFIAVGLTMWVEVARLVRGQVIAVRENEYVTAAQSLGYSNLRTIFFHILPNILGPVIVVSCANFAGAILIESGMSYIGLGVQPPSPSWGGMLSEYKNFIDTDKAYLAIWPGVCIMVLVLAFNLLGNGLRDAFDVKGKSE